MRPSYSELERHRERERLASSLLRSVNSYLLSLSLSCFGSCHYCISITFSHLCLVAEKKSCLWVRKFEGLVVLYFCFTANLRVQLHMGLRLFVLDLWGLLLSQSHSCSVYSVMNSLIFILFCLFWFDPVWLLRKKKMGLWRNWKKRRILCWRWRFCCICSYKSIAFSIIYFCLLITLFLLK